ncbi:ZMYND11 [Cordylochernes scorpioides]|uniref:ZMYND11 n=1 Tax=Cordylochernes scorpioides TaxID=51811 RepID=A0ABY6KG04_9ARAC|nr:ZMYND11 [Cordylochernes scorpioides]
MGTVRRYTHPARLQPLWDAIVSIRNQRQVPNRERIAAFMKRKSPGELPTLDETLRLAIQDNCVYTKTSKGHKGVKAGVEQESYRAPDSDLEGDGHDWYCFECHENGDVILCSTCHRVYHRVCLKEEFLEAEVFSCPVCAAIKNQEPSSLNNEDLNLLLTFTCYRLKDKVKNLLQIQVEEDDVWRQSYLCFRKMDLTIMEAKAKEQEYQSLEEYVADARTIIHNIVIYFGVHNPLADLARQMLRDCLYDIAEIRLCSDCYRMSNEKADKHWFCQPCDPPHELVYAKQKGFPFWPAKVLRIHENMYDVRFFGGYHERSLMLSGPSFLINGCLNRALVEEDNVKPIETTLQELSLKKSVTLNRALDELKRHQMLLKQGVVIQKDMTPLKRSQLAALKHPSRAKKKIVSPNPNRGHTSPDSGIEGNASPAFKDVGTPPPPPEDLVSSTLESPSLKVSVSTQSDPPPPCDCEAKYSSLFTDFRQRMEQEHRDDKERSMRDLAERLRMDLEAERERQVGAAVEAARREQQVAVAKLEAELAAQHSAQLQALLDRHKTELSHTKKRQWCYNCEQEAIYHCCWNTSYCSVECQQQHWHKEHKRTCRRKR